MLQPELREYIYISLTNIYPVAFDARAELLDKRAFTSIIQYSEDFGCRAYCMLHSPIIPRWRTTYNKKHQFKIIRASYMKD